MKKYTYLVIIALLLCNLILIYQYKGLEKSAHSIADKYSTLSVTENRINNNLKSFSLYHQEYENSIMPIIKFRRDETLFHDSIHLYNTKEPLFCFRFKETHCDACIQKTLTLLNEINRNFPVRIIVLCSFTNYNQFAAFRSRQSNNIKILNIEEISWNVDTIEQSYFFIIQKGYIHNLFVPLKEDWDYVKKYIQIIRHKYWEESSCSEECQLNGLHT